MFDRQNVWQLFRTFKSIGLAHAKVGTPITKEWPIFIICLGVHGFRTLRSIRALMIHPDPTLGIQRVADGNENSKEPQDFC